MNKYFTISVLMQVCLLLSCSALAQTTSTPIQTSSNRAFMNDVLQHIQEGQIYLRQLSDVQSAVEKELSIVRLIRECGSLDAVCTGQGVSVMPSNKTAVPQQPAAPAPDRVQNTDKQRSVRASARAPRLPELIRISGSMATLRHAGKWVAVKAGEHIGGFDVRAVNIDDVELSRHGKSYRLPLEWTRSSQQNSTRQGRRPLP